LRRHKLFCYNCFNAIQRFHFLCNFYDPSALRAHELSFLSVQLLSSPSSWGFGRAHHIYLVSFRSGFNDTLLNCFARLHAWYSWWDGTENTPFSSVPLLSSLNKGFCITTSHCNTNQFSHSCAREAHGPHPPPPWFDLEDKSLSVLMLPCAAAPPPAIGKTAQKAALLMNAHTEPLNWEKWTHEYQSVHIRS
jgi:hypothetical protein